MTTEDLMRALASESAMKKERRRILIKTLYTIINDLENGYDGFMYLYYELRNKGVIKND